MLRLPKNKFILLLFLLTLMLFYKVILNPGMMIYSDASDITFFESHKILKFDTLREYGTIPLWNPYSLADSTFVGSMVVGLFYPINVLDFLIEPHSVFGYYFIIHVFLFGFFVYLYMRVLGLRRFSAFISAIIAMFSGKVITQVYAGNINQMAFVWLPLIFLFFELSIRKKSYFYATLTGITIAIQFLGVHSQQFLYDMLAFFLYFIFRSFMNIKKTGVFKRFFEYSSYVVVAMCVFLLTSSIQIIPFMETAKFNYRAGGVGWDFATHYSLPPLHLIKFIFPNFFGTPLNHTYWGAPNFWESTGYSGITALILCLFALIFKRNRYVIFFFGLAVFSLLFSFGKYTPLFSFFYNYAPLFNLFRVPTRMLTVYTFAMSVMAGFGIDFLITKMKKNDRNKLIKIVKSLIIIAILGLIIFLFIMTEKEDILSFGKKLVMQKYEDSTLPHEGPHSRSLDYYLENVQIVFNGVLKDAFVFLFALTSFIFLSVLLIKKRLKLPYFKTLLTVLIVCELWSFALPLIDVIDPNIMYKENEVINFLLQDKGLYRVVDIQGTNLKSWHSINYGIVHIDGFHAVDTKRYLDIMEDIMQMNILPERRTIPEGNYPLLNLLNTKYIISEKTTDSPGYKLVYNGTNHVFNLIEKKQEVRKNVYIYENKNVLSRAYVMHNARLIKDEKKVMETILYDKEFNPKEYIIIEKDIGKPLSNKGNFSEAKISFYSPNKIIVEANLDNAGFLVLSEMWYPGWKAFEGNKDYEIYQTNYLFRSVYLDKGYHKIVFVFDPLSFKIGLWLTLISLSALIILFIYKIKIHKNKNKR